MKAALKNTRWHPSAVGAVQRKSLTVSQAVETIAKAKPQAMVMMMSLYKPSATFVREMKHRGVLPLYMTLPPSGPNCWPPSWEKPRAASTSPK